MKEHNKGIWIGTKDLTGSEELLEQAKQEFYELPAMNDLANDDVYESDSDNTSRRDFLKYMGFGIGAAVLAASCETPVRRALPYVTKPDAIVPGVATYYASAMVRGGDFCPILVKTREGRPIKIEGNVMSSMTKGGTSARAQALVLELYDRSRIKNPGKIVDPEDGEVQGMKWSDVDAAIMKGLNAGSSVRIVSNTVISPSTLQVIEDFKGAYQNTEHVMYDPVSFSALLDAQEQSTGLRVVPDYDFDKAEMIVSFGADFLGTWNSPVEYASGFASKRKVDSDKPSQSRFYMVESHMSLSGSNADNRIPVRPSEMGIAIALVHDVIAKNRGYSTVGASDKFASEAAKDHLTKMAQDMMRNSSAGNYSIVFSASNNVAEQLLINHINEMLGNVGNSVKYGNHSNQRKGDDKAIVKLMQEMNAGVVDVVIFLDDVNPVYDLPDGDKFAQALSKVGLKISTTSMRNETMALCDYVCPVHHNLESWGDAEPKNGFYTVVQPTIEPLFNTRYKESSLLKWAGNESYFDTDKDPYYLYIKENWKKNIFPRQSQYADFRAFWDMTVHDGVLEITRGEQVSSDTIVAGLGGRISKPGSAELEVFFYENVNVGTGTYANNPWLQEMPDPLSRTVWDNFINIPVAWKEPRYFVGYNKLGSGDIATLSIGDTDLKMTVVESFGQPDHSVAVALGYGRTVCGPAGRNVGVNAYPALSRDSEGYIQYYASDADLSGRQGEDKTFASVQYHHTYGLKGESQGETVNLGEKAATTIAAGYQGGIVDRTIIRQADLSQLGEALKLLDDEKQAAEELNSQTLYKGHGNLYGVGHKWEMTIDLSACIGCGACQVACIAENNVPVVGKYEVKRHHEMTWLRIDRYYYGEFGNPNVVYQPMMCQHCDNAPCENVCPVNATNHSSEGLNQMVYNRCIGTRYCANNCPYKVRRFNWLDYTSNDLFGRNENQPFEDDDDVPFYADNLTRMVLNPDVTVRARGVMEKCTFCVQRVQEGKLAAKTENRAVRDGEINTACATACPTGAIVFGDVNDNDSRISKEVDDPRYYQALMELNTRPGVGYKMKVLNRNGDITDIDKLAF